VAGAAVLGRLTWQVATVVELRAETPSVRSIALDVPDWPGHRAGQHVDVRLTADDGYQAQRSYSLASGPEDPSPVLTVERVDDGEVSPYLVDELRPGDQIEVRGPIGGYFVWEQSLGGPLLLLAGGSGIVPLRSMLRHWAANESTVPVRVLSSARAIHDVIYRQELTRLAEREHLDFHITLTREWPDDWTGYRGRLDRALLEEIAWPPADRSLVYVCGPTGFVETAADLLVELGHEAGRIRAERFGPTGGST
jgi:ferredoxin-NADP reductase